MATSLVGKPSKLIGVVIRDLKNPYFTEISDAIERTLSKAKYQILYYNTREDHDREVLALNTLLSYNVDGLIMTPILRVDDLKHILRFSLSNKPIITIEPVPAFGLDYVDHDPEKSGYLATQHLIEMGHRNIRHLAGPTTAASAEKRIIGFKQCMRDNGLELDDSKIIPAGAYSDDGFKAAMKALQNPAGRPTALFCFSDLVASGVYRAAHKLGLRIPDDVSIIGIDDTEMSAILGPSLTTVSLRIQEMAAFVAKRLIENIKSKRQKSGLAKVFEPHLITRESVRRLN